MATHIIDLRSAQDFRARHLPGSINLNEHNFLKYAKALFNEGDCFTFITSENLEVDFTRIQKQLKEWKMETEESRPIESFTDTGFESLQVISAQDFLALTDDYLLLDVRTSEEITRPAPEKNLVHIPLAELNKELAQLEQGKTIYTLCGSGTRATVAASILKKAGMEAIVIDGGIAAVNEALSRKD